jgi:ACT domain-containing protein
MSGDGATGATSEAAEADEELESDGSGEGPQAHTVRLELVDEPGELLAALRPIAENGGNLLSILHERGNLTPRGHIPVEVDFECPPDRFEVIVDALREGGVNVMQAGAERYVEEVVVLLTGDLVDADLSDVVRRVESGAHATVTDLSLSAPEGMDESASARLRLGAREGRTEATLETVREVADGKGLRVVEPLAEGSA